MNTAAVDLKRHLESLQAEEAAAQHAGLSSNDLYWGALHQDLVAAEAAYVGAAVTEIASLRAQLHGPLQG